MVEFSHYWTLFLSIESTYINNRFRNNKYGEIEISIITYENNNAMEIGKKNETLIVERKGCNFT